MDPTTDPALLAAILQGQGGGGAPMQGSEQNNNPMLSMPPDQLAALQAMMQTSGQNGAAGDNGQMQQTASLGSSPYGMLNQMPPGYNWANAPGL